MYLSLSKIFIYILIFFSFLSNFNAYSSNQNKFYSKKNISNYFLGIVSSNNNNNKLALQYLSNLSLLKNNHDQFNRELVFALVQTQKIPKAFLYLKKLKTKNINFFHANLLLGINYFLEKKYKKSIVYFNSIIINNPLFTQAYNKKKLIKPNYPIKKILIGTFTYTGSDINVHYSDHEKYIEDIVSTLIEIQKNQKFEFEISIKTHPSDPKGYYTWFINKLGFKKLNIIETGNFQKIVADFDFVIMSYSTAIFESALMGIPVLFYHPSKQMLHEPFNGKSPLPSAFSKKELFVALNKITSDIEFAYRFLKPENLFPYAGEINKQKKYNVLSVLIDSLK